MFKYLSFHAFAICSLIILISCSTEPQTIAYNEDQCAECKMMISDQRYGAELVTKKGKVYKYDAAECMISALRKNEYTDYAHILVTDFTNPAQLIDAKSSTFLVSKLRPSPMGANLSAYSTENKIENLFISEDHEIFTWDQIMKNL